MASVFDLKHKMIKNYTNKGINILNIAYPYSIGEKECCDDIYKIYKKPSRTKIHWFNFWKSLAFNSYGNTYFSIVSHNCQNFSVVFDFIAEHSKYVAYITKDNVYIVLDFNF